MKKDSLQNLPQTVHLSEFPTGKQGNSPFAEENRSNFAGNFQNQEMSSRFADARLEMTYPGETAGLHAHSHYEVIYCLSGSADYQLGDLRYRLNHGDLFTVPLGAVHAPVVPEGSPEPFRRYVLRLSPEFSQLVTTLFLPDANSHSQAPILLHTAGTAWEYIGEFFRRCAQETEQRHYRWEAVVFSIATELMVHMSRCWQGNLVEEKPELLDRIMGHVESHLAEKITLPDIAARFWVSQSTISQLFRKKMGISFYRYVTLRRLTEAKVLIKTGIPMDQVSIAVGFQDYSTFYRAFKSEFGISPAQFRKMQ